jgi:hypothetical protein
MCQYEGDKCARINLILAKLAFAKFYEACFTDNSILAFSYHLKLSSAS